MLPETSGRIFFTQPVDHTGITFEIGLNGSKLHCVSHVRKGSLDASRDEISGNGPPLELNYSLESWKCLSAGALANRSSEQPRLSLNQAGTGYVAPGLSWPELLKPFLIFSILTHKSCYCLPLPVDFAFCATLSLATGPVSARKSYATGLTTPCYDGGFALHG